MSAKIVSQKKFSKLVASTGSLSQPPGALPRMSNLLFTQRGSLQIANGSLKLSINSLFPLAYALALLSFTKANSATGIGQYPPILARIMQLASTLLPSGVGNVAATPTAGGSNPNQIGYYQFAVVAIGPNGGTSPIGSPSSWVTMDTVAFGAFNTATITWSNNIGNNAGYQIWFLGFGRYGMPSPYPSQQGYLLGTVAANVTTFTTTATQLSALTPLVQAPWLNDTQYIFLNDVVCSLNEGGNYFSPTPGGIPPAAANYNIFPAVAPQPVSLQIGDPQFNPSFVLPGYSPYGGISGQACPIPTAVQFAGQVIAILGNGLPPVAYDPSTDFEITPPAPAPLANTFQDAFPDWQASVTWLTGSQVTDGAGNYYTATQGGVSGATVPTPWNTALGAQTADGTVLWTSQGPIVASTAPRGAAHAVAYAGSLWLANTSPADTSDGIDGPSCLKMSDSNNPNSWNPVNTAFVGRQDGSQITGLCPFTIAALGISPTGSLCIFKEFTTYQFIGVFGTTSFEIQPAQTNLGCIAARSIQFLPGFGVVRFTHLGFAVFDGINDRLISEDIRPYLFGGVDSEADLTPVDPTYCYLSQSAQTVAPPMYLCAMPLLGAAGALTRLFCYDLVMKSWAVLDLPWAITSMATVAGGEGYPLVLAGKTDGTIQRLQAGDLNWDQGDTAQSAVQWSFRTPELFGEGGTQRLFYEKATITGYGSPAMVQSIIANLWLDGQQIGAQGIDVVPMGGSNLFTASVSIFRNGNRAHLDISGNSGGATGVIDSVDWAVTAKSSMARRIIS